MAISGDFDQLETISRFVAFIEALQDVDKIKGLIDDAKAVLAQKQEVLGAEFTKNEADSYAAKKRQEADAYVAARTDDIVRLRAEVEEAKQKAVQQNNQLNDRITEYDNLIAAVKNEKQAVELFKKKVEAERQNLQLSVEEFNKKQAEYNQLKADLDFKAEQLKKVLG